MARPIYLQLTKPCQEKWSEMTAVEQGAFCKSCRKNVIDFTRKTENEIYDIVTQSGGELCGRLTQFQLNQPIRKTEVKNGLFNWRAIAASLAALIAFDKTAKAGNEDSTRIIEYRKLPNSCTIEPDTVLLKPNAITGRVVDAETKEPLEGATIRSKHARTYAITGANGVFVLENAALLIEDTLQLDCFFYRQQDIPVAQFICGSTVGMEAYSKKLLIQVGGMSYSYKNPLEEIGGYNDLTPLFYRERKKNRKKN